MKARKAGGYFCTEQAKRNTTHLLRHVSELLSSSRHLELWLLRDPQVLKTLKKEPCKSREATEEMEDMDLIYVKSYLTAVPG